MIIALGVVFGVKTTRESLLVENYGNTDYVKPFVIENSYNEAEFTTISCQ